MQPQVFDLLVHLIRNRNRVVGKEDLISLVWNGRIVSDSTLTSRINAARTALDDSGEAQRLIRTVPRKGLRFVGEVEEQPAAAGPADASRLPEQTPRQESRASDRPAIAVLAFENMSRDPEQEYFCDGLSEDLLTALSKVKLVLRHRPELFLQLEGRSRHYQSNRRRALGTLRGGGQRTQGGRAGPDHRPAQ